MDWAGSGQKAFESHGSDRVTLTREVTLPAKNPGILLLAVVVSLSACGRPKMLRFADSIDDSKGGDFCT